MSTVGDLFSEPVLMTPRANYDAVRRVIQSVEDRQFRRGETAAVISRISRIAADEMLRFSRSAGKTALKAAA